MPSVQDASLHRLGRRADPPSGNTGLSGIYIAGIVVVVVIVLAVSTWLGTLYVRKQRAKKRESQLGAAFLSVRGIVKDQPSESGSTGEEKSARPQLHVQTGRNGFSRANLNAGIPMPERTLAPRTREDIIEFHRQSGNFPKPFTLRGSPSSPTSPSFLSAPERNIQGRSPVSSNRDSQASWVRHSFMSLASGRGRYSVSSSVASSFGSDPTTGQSRKVRQLFQPVLPDELLLTSLGEQLVVVQSFDDGWCVVGRENTSGFQQKKSLFKSAPEGEKDVEMGVVPAWVFLKPVKGLRAERPVRSTSLGITVQIEAPAAERENMISWSNF